MNERIRELAREADIVKILEEHASEYGGGTFENTAYPELEKFAELIVRECVGVAVDNGCGDFVDIEHLLLKHFGVEL